MKVQPMQAKPVPTEYCGSPCSHPLPFPHPAQWTQSPSWLSPLACPQPALHSLFTPTCVHVEPPARSTKHHSMPSLMAHFFLFLMLPFIQVHSEDSARCFLKLGLPSLLGGLPPPPFSSLQPTPDLLQGTWAVLPLIIP